MDLKEIYRPIEKELLEVEKILQSTLIGSKYRFISKVSRYLLNAGGKRLRPALVIFSAKASAARRQARLDARVVNIAAALELIHLASLIHDDIIDHALSRHNKPTLNSKWGSDVSLTLGDYLYSIAFKLIASCGSIDILDCLSSAAKSMCEGELIQVCERDNLNLLKKRYIIIVKKKTASLFAASCETGALVSGGKSHMQEALKEYGLNFGVAFQITDDCLDIIGGKRDLGKAPGADFKMGELTLPALNLLLQQKDKSRIINLIKQQDEEKAFAELKRTFIASSALPKTKDEISGYIRKAKDSLNSLEPSCFKSRLSDLADFVFNRVERPC